MEDNQALTLSVEDAAKILGIGRALAYRLCAQRKMPGLLVLGKRFVISKIALDRVLAEGYQFQEDL